MLENTIWIATNLAITAAVAIKRIFTIQILLRSYAYAQQTV